MLEFVSHSALIYAARCPADSRPELTMCATRSTVMTICGGTAVRFKEEDKLRADNDHFLKCGRSFVRPASSSNLRIE